ncbi:MAG: hypothetical protein SFX72_09355 [Isosphaeraceae bacterium]|nr:hypothetical protein [Isosphaeraceae bacterium]
MPGEEEFGPVIACDINGDVHMMDRALCTVLGGREIPLQEIDGEIITCEINGEHHLTTRDACELFGGFVVE